MQPRLLIGLTAASVLGALVVSGARRSDASCAARLECPVATATVLRCTPVDTEREPSLARYVAELRKQKQEARARELLASYRGALVEVKVQSRAMQACHDSDRPASKRKPVDETGYAIGGDGLWPKGKTGEVTYFVPAADGAAACAARFPVDRTLRILAADSCCDGDPNPPCLLRR